MAKARTIEMIACAWNGLDIGSRRGVKAVPCCGSIDLGSLLSPLWEGAPGVIVAACREDECHHRNGSRQARALVAVARRLLAAAGVNPERLRFIEVPRSNGASMAELQCAILDMEGLGRLERQR